MTVLDESILSIGPVSDEHQILETGIDDGRGFIPLHLSVPSQMIRLSEIVPLAQAIGHKLNNAVIDRLTQKGTPITCCKGCSACCHYLVSLSIPEVFYLQEKVAAMPTRQYRSFLRSCVLSARRILGNSVQKPEITEHPDPNQLSQWYAGLELPCPFLSDNMCRIYQHRPLACREHMVTSSPKHCQPGHAGDPDVVAPSVSVVEALGQLAAELEQTDVQAAILPLAFIGPDIYEKRPQQTWPAMKMVQQFIRILQQMAQSDTE